MLAMMGYAAGFAVEVDGEVHPAVPTQDG